MTNYTLWSHEYTMRPTKMAVIDVGRACNARCQHCYYLYSNEVFQKTLDELNYEMIQAAKRGCDRIDYTGGEPTINPHIPSHIKFCNEHGITPRIITNGQKPCTVRLLILLGCKDFLLSIHHVKGKLDEFMGMENTWDNIAETIQIIKENNAKFAVNTVITKQNSNCLEEIAKEVLKFEPYIYNLIFANEQYKATQKQNMEILPQIIDVAWKIQNIINIFNTKNIWTNVRYFPMCTVSPAYRKHIVNHPQVMFDWRNEWDYGVELKTPENYLNYAKLNFQVRSNSQFGKCGECNKLDVCGGLKNVYENCYGEVEIYPQQGLSNDPFYYRSEMEDVDIIIPAYKINANLSLLLNEIINKTAPNYNIILLHQEKSAARNRNDALNRSKAPFTIMIDDDISELPYLWNKKLIDRLLYNPDIMAISARLMDRDGKIGRNTANNYNISSEFEEVGMIPTACCIFRRNDISSQRSGLRFNENFLGSGFEDTTFFTQLKKSCIKRQVGTKIIIDNTIKVVHMNNEVEMAKWYYHNEQIYRMLI